MKLLVKENNIEAVGVTSNNKFTINANAKMFRILSDTLYSNKPKALIRELVCNAYDAQKENGNPDTYIEVNTPTRLNALFSIRDYGVGMSHDFIMRRYSSYGDSSKDQTNDYVGCLGLGSKTPFIFTNNFTITSWHKGIKNIYSAFKDNNGEPNISHLHASPSSDPSGTRIEFSTPSIDGIEAEVRYYGQFFPVKLNGAAIPRIEYKYHGDDWGFVEAGDTFAIMGGVPYPIDSKYIPWKGKYSWQPKPALHITFDIGELDIAVNRESLSYDEVTISNLQNKLARVQAEVNAKLFPKIGNFNSIYEYALAYRNTAATTNWTADHTQQYVTDKLQKYTYFQANLFSRKRFMDAWHATVPNELNICPASNDLFIHVPSDTKTRRMFDKVKEIIKGKNVGQVYIFKDLPPDFIIPRNIFINLDGIVLPKITRTRGVTTKSVGVYNLDGSPLLDVQDDEEFYYALRSPGKNFSIDKFTIYDLRKFSGIVSQPVRVLTHAAAKRYHNATPITDDLMSQKAVDKIDWNLYAFYHDFGGVYSQDVSVWNWLELQDTKFWERNKHRFDKDKAKVNRCFELVDLVDDKTKEDKVKTVMTKQLRKDINTYSLLRVVASQTKKNIMDELLKLIKLKEEHGAK